MFGVVSDVTNKLAAEAQLLTALEEARAAADAKAAFLATMSHEIRTPMTGVLGMIELLRSKPTAGEQVRYLDTLKQSANLLMSVLNDVLDFSRLDSGHVDLAIAPFDLEHLLRSTVRLFGNAATTKGLRLELDWQGPVGAWVAGDPMRLQQVVSNLVSNAIKFTDQGHIVVHAAKEPRRGKPRWRIEVRDEGIGIDRPDQERLFEPFMQADGSAGRRFGGTGLGLAISRRLVEGMGGTLGLTSALGRGSVFWLELPLPKAAPVPAVPLPLPAACGSPAARRLTVLVAEDNPVNQLLIQALLRQMGHHPTCVADGRAAVEAARARRFDCILMDMQMPQLDGVSAAREIRGGSGPSADIPIIALTADATPQRRSAYLIDAIDQVLTKPLDPSGLAEVLTQVASGQPVHRPLSPSSRPQPLDRRQLTEIRSALGEERTSTLLGLFVQELAVRPGIIRAAIGRSDLAAAASEAHSLKGAALSMGGRAVGQAAARLERLLSSTGGEGGQALHRALRDLDQAVATTVAALPPDSTPKPQQAA